MNNPQNIQENGRPIRMSLWDRFNKNISEFGEKMEEMPEKTLGFCRGLIKFLIVMSALICFICVSIHEGFWEGVLTLVVTTIAGIIIWYASKWVLGASVYLGRQATRHICRNAVIFTLSVSMILLFFSGGAISLLTMPLPKIEMPQTIAYVENLFEENEEGDLYISNVPRLNIRTSPQLTSDIIGIIRNGQKIRVFDVEGDFARISYNGGDAYVIFRFMEPI